MSLKWCSKVKRLTNYFFYIYRKGLYMYVVMSSKISYNSCSNFMILQLDFLEKMVEFYRSISSIFSSKLEYNGILVNILNYFVDFFFCANKNIKCYVIYKPWNVNCNFQKHGCKLKKQLNYKRVWQFSLIKNLIELKQTLNNQR